MRVITKHIVRTSLQLNVNSCKDLFVRAFLLWVILSPQSWALHKTNQDTPPADVLVGQSTYKATWLQIPIYELSLYSHQPVRQIEDLIGYPWRAELRFLRDLSRERVSESFLESITDNCLGSCVAEQEALRLMMTQAPAQFPRGSVLVFWGSPGRVRVVNLTQFQEWILNAPQMDQALLRVWIGPSPPSQSFKQRLLKELEP